MGPKNKIRVVLVALYRYRNFPIRIMHPLLEKMEGVKVYTVFLKNCEGNLFTYPSDEEKEFFKNIMVELNPDIVGFSVLSPTYTVAIELNEIVSKYTNALRVWGGVHPTIFPDSCVDFADIVCRGEGEGAMVDLVACLRDKVSFKGVQNLWIVESNKIVKNPMRKLIQDLDGLPYPEYGNENFYFIDSDRLTRDDPVVKEGLLWIQASRGCPYTCSYCINSLKKPMMRGLGSYTRIRSVSSVLEEIKDYTGTYGLFVDRVFFVDEVFATDDTWLTEFEARYKKEVGLPFIVEYNPLNIKADMISRLVGAGLDTINIGIQSGSDYVRNKVFNRAGKNDEILSVVRELKRYDVKIKYDLILDNPYDTVDTLKETIEFILKLPKPLSFNLFSLQYFPDYPLTKKAIEDGNISESEINLIDLTEKTMKNWSFNPKKIFSNKEKLQSVIWLLTWNHVRNKTVKRVISGDSSLLLNYLHLKALVYSRVFGVGGFFWKHKTIHHVILTFKFIYHRDFKLLMNKIKSRIKFLLYQYR
ncbi:MAG: B12-binding domain-containing radical SAM protein [Candidatus Hodarchaeales archaeon]|jgi:radical SAM superfamily enzyme YgiQ (UPF0313 family)